MTGPDAADAARQPGKAVPARTAEGATPTRPGASAAPDRTADNPPPPAPRYQVYRSVLPEVCAADPALMVFTADAEGRCEVFTWDAGARQARQVTDRPQGTLHGAIDRDAYVWWFDEDADGAGHWRYQPFHGGPDRTGLLDVPAGVPRGLAVSDDATVAMGLGDGRTTSVYVGPRGGPAAEVTRVDGHATLSGITPAGGLLAVSGPAGSAHAVTVLTGHGVPRAVLSGERGRLWALGFAPTADRDELLLIREADDRYLLASWQPGAGVADYPWCAFDTEITAGWYPEGRAALIRQDRHGRSTLHRADLDTGALTPVPTEPGSLLDAAPRAGGDVHHLWTATAHPPRMRSTAGTPLPPLGTVPGRVPGDHRDLWTPGPAGPVHTLLSLPDDRDRAAPPALVFLVHGGPADHDRDAYDGVVHSLVASGFAVARVNYRGSTGYGPRWRRDFSSGVGLTQVDDLVAVRADLLGRGLVNPDAVGLWGTSWGGYLVLLALGRRPDLWQAGVAVKPVADSAAAYRSTTPALRALDERLYGGTPDALPEVYARSSPIHYAAQVSAPLLVVAATHDAKCPPGQVRSYLAALRTAGARHESMWLDTGHDGYEGGDHVAVLRRAVVFLDRELRGSGSGRTPKTPPADRRGDSGRSRTTAPAGTGTAEHR